MAQYDFNALLQAAQAEGFSDGALVPDGVYIAEVTHANVGQSQGGKDQIGVRWRIVDGPQAGQSAWDNQTISPENPKAMAAFFGWCARFGLDSAFFQRQPPPTVAEIAAHILNKTARVKVGNRSYGTPPKTVNTFRVEEVLTGVPAPAGAVPPPPVAAPAPVAPAPVPAEAPQAPPAAPVAAPVAPVAPAPVAAPEPAPVAEAPVPAAPVAAPIDPATGLPARPW